MVVSYIGKVTIDVNPFDSVGDGEAEIILEMEQNGWVTTIKQEVLTVNDFPLTVTNIEGESASVGTVRMYVDGALFIMPGDTEATTWSVEFETVEE